MNELLSSRYSALFAGYGVGSDRALINTKDRIAKVLQERPDWLRPDAAYALIVNLDHMIRIPCSGYIPRVGDNTGVPIDVHIKSSVIEETLAKYLSSLLADLENNEEAPISAHAIFRSADRNWEHAKALFLW